MIETPVLIVGGGPVGLTLAGELGWQGSSCLLVEERTEPTQHPKATLLGARSMEFYRRWGIVDAIYAAALPPDINYFITFSTRLAGYELHRLTSPSIRQTIERPPEVMARYRELGWSPYYKTQIGQQALEPVLLDFVGSLTPVQMRHGWRLLDFMEEADHVSSRIEEVATGRIETVRSRYLVACDGGSSSVRRRLGVRMNGRGRMRANVSFYFESDEFLNVHERGVGNLYFVFAPDSFGLFTAIDGIRRWAFQYYFLDASRRTDDLDPEAVLHRAVGRPFAFELKGVQHWHHHQSVARQWRSALPSHDGVPRPGRVFLAGDAAHLFAPTGGVGMNTGIGDAIDLGWKLDAVLKGWGGDVLLASYERERKPIAVRNSVISANNSDKIDMIMDETPPEIEEDSIRGAFAREEVARKIRWMARQFNSAGTHVGYRYIDSPVIAHEASPEPPDDPTQVSPSTWPGSRAPHAWTTGDTSVRGHSTLDWFGRGFVLLHAQRPEAAEAIRQAFAAQSTPITLQPLTQEVVQLYEAPLVLVRPDGHVAWRGTDAPADASALVRLLRGA